MYYLYPMKEKFTKCITIEFNKHYKTKKILTFTVKGCFSLATNLSRSPNQKGNAIKSSKSETSRVGSRTLILVMSPLLMMK